MTDKCDSATDGGILVGRTLPRCQVCQESYSFPGTNSRFNQHLPVLLTCGHIICEKCLWKAKARHVVKCPTCNMVIPLNLKRKTSEQFEFNFYAFGLIKHITTFGEREDLIDVSSIVVPKCGECSDPVADRRCLQCDSLYCYECFKKIHHFSKVLRTHQTLELAVSAKFQHTPTQCDIHSGQQVNYYCETCDKAICLECKTHIHLIHVVSQLFQKNATAQKDIGAYITLLIQLQQLNEKSIETCNSALQTSKMFAQETIDEISNYFIELHGSLQLLETQLVKKVKDRYREDLMRFQDTQEKLRSNKGQIELNLEKLNYYSRNTPYNLDLESLLKDLSSFMKELPCDLSVVQSPHNPFTFERPPTPIDLSNGFRLRWNEGVALHVKPCENISPIHQMPSTSEAFSHGTPRGSKDRRSSMKSQSECERSGTSNSSLDRSKDTDQPRLKKHRKHSSSHKDPCESNQERPSSRHSTRESKILLLPKIESDSVHVSHINNPHTIYIQNLTFVSNTKHFFEMCAEVAKQQVKPEEIVMGEMYLLKDVSEGSTVARWYRAIARGKNEKKKLYDMFLVDFGNVRKISKSQVRICPDVLKQQPRGAIHCSLYNLEPMKGKWMDDVNCMLSELIMTDSITKMTLGMQCEVHVVDLIVMKNLAPVSIRNTLVNVGLAREVRSTDFQMTQLIIELNKTIHRAHSDSPKFYAQTVTVGGYFPPKVIHVVSPMEFYVMKTLDVHLYEEQKKAMEKYYADDTHKERVYSLKVGTPVAINYLDHWYRGEVINIVVGTLQVDVQLVDRGFKHTVNQRNLRVLHSEFMKLSKGAISCSLVHVAPSEQNGFKWSQEALEAFRAFTSSDNLELFVHSANSAKRDSFNVTLYSVRRDKNISINAQLVQMEFATSTGSESVQVEFLKDIDDVSDEANTSRGIEGAKSEENEKKTSVRKNAKIVNIVSPGEFYVVFLEHISGIEHVQRKIQKQMIDYVEPSVLPDWKINDVCFVRTETADDPIMEWRRAFVKRQYESLDEYDVFLLDAGVLVRVEKEDMAVIENAKGWDSCPGAVRCHMSNISPTSGKETWTASTIDKLKSYCKSKKFEGYAVTMMGNFINNSAPVVLWGRIEEDDPLQPTIVRWKNLNESLAKRGYVELIEHFPKTFDNSAFEMELRTRNEEFEKFIESLNMCPPQDKAEEEKDPFEAELSADITMVLEWKPVEPLNRVVFMGVTTCVDNNGIIHMYDVKNRTRLDSMRSISSEVFKETLPSPVEQFWAKNQPCMAKYHLDDKFYRGIVRRVDKEKSQCLVQFVDYGNIEQCTFKDMRKNLLFGNIPIQSYRFKLINILPIKKDEPWPCHVLDKMHAYTVGHECSVTLSDPPDAINTNNRIYDIIKLRMGDIDLVQYLLQEGMAVLANDSDALAERTALECIAPPEAKEKTKEKEVPFSNLNTINDFREYFVKMDMINASVVLEPDSDEDKTDDGSVIESSSETSEDETTMETVKKKTRSELSLDTSFKPMYTSTTVDAPPSVFTYLTLEDNCTGFFGTTTELMSPVDLYFFPEIAEHVKMHKDMDKCLQTAGSFYSAVTTVSPTTAYLVQYDEDSRWYRAIVDSSKIVGDEVQVKFVDYLNTEVVKLSKVKPLNVNLQSAPLRNLHLRLAGVTVNPRYRSEDVEQELRKLLDQKKVYVKIVRQGTPHMVQIYEDKDEKKLIYRPMIEKRFFILDEKI